MRSILKATAFAGALALAACGGKGDDALGDNVADAADNAADNLDAMADNASNPSDEANLEAQADALRAEGEAKKDAIDDADVNADAMTGAQKDAITNGM